MYKVVLVTDFLVQAYCKDLGVVQVAGRGDRTSSEDHRGALQRATEPQNADIVPCDERGTHSGVTCLHPYVAMTDSSTLPVTPKGMKWLTKEENYVEDEQICTFNHLSVV